MKVLVLGGAGGMAYCTIRDFLEYDEEELTELVLADRDYDRVKAVADGLKSPKVRAVAVDCADLAGLVKVMRGCDVVINATTCFGDVPVNVLKASLEAGTNVIDLGADSDGTKACLAMDSKFKEAGLTSIVGLGSSPGTLGIATRALVDMMDTVKSIKLLFTYGSTGTTTRPFNVPFYGSLGEFINDPTIFDGGEYKSVPARSGIEQITYPEPFGKRTFMYVPHSEVTTFPVSFADKGIEHVSVKGGFLPDFYEKATFLASIGLLSGEPLAAGGVKVVPMEVVEECVKRLPPEEGDVREYGVQEIIARGVKDGRRVELTATVLSYPYRGLTTPAHRTGHPPAIGARFICKGIINKKGAFPPELVVEPTPFFEELARREIDVYVTSKTYL